MMSLNLKKMSEEEIEKKRAHEESNGFSDLEEEPYGISCSGYRFTAEELKEIAREIDR